MPLNCWEFKDCGREEGGANEDLLGVCPAAQTSSYDGINSGRYAGRTCWLVVGTLCDGVPQQTFTAKYRDCLKCEFLRLVCAEEQLLAEELFRRP